MTTDKDAMSILRTNLTEAAAILRKYETYHRAKNTEDSNAKAEVNAELAGRFEAALSATAPVAAIQPAGEVLYFVTVVGEERRWREVSQKSYEAAKAHPDLYRLMTVPAAPAAPVQPTNSLRDIKFDGPDDPHAPGAAPVQHDASEAEQVAFEKAYRHKFTPNMRNYTDELQANWDGWQTRAALATREAKADTDGACYDALMLSRNLQAVGWRFCGDGDALSSINAALASEAKDDAAPVGMPDLSYDMLTPDDMKRNVQQHKQERCAHDFKHSPGFGGDFCAKCGMREPSPPPATGSNTTAGADALRNIRDVATFDPHGDTYYRKAENALAAIECRDAEPNKIPHTTAGTSIGDDVAKEVVDYVYSRVLHHDKADLVPGVQAIIDARQPTADLIEQAAAICEGLGKLYTEACGYDYGFTTAANRCAREIRDLEKKK